MHSQVKFWEVEIGQRFTFTEDTENWLGLCEKIDSNHYVVCANRRIVVKVGNTIKWCVVQNAQ